MDKEQNPQKGGIELKEYEPCNMAVLVEKIAIASTPRILPGENEFTIIGRDIETTARRLLISLSVLEDFLVKLPEISKITGTTAEQRSAAHNDAITLAAQMMFATIGGMLRLGLLQKVVDELKPCGDPECRCADELKQFASAVLLLKPLFERTWKRQGAI